MNAEINTRIIDSIRYLTDSLQVTLKCRHRGGAAEEGKTFGYGRDPEP